MRDYDPSIGRYVESDPLGLKGGIDTYVYALDHPLTSSDPFGLLVRGSGLSDAGWAQVQAAEAKIRKELAKKSDCKDSSCIPDSVKQRVLNALAVTVVNLVVNPGNCGDAPVPGKYLDVTVPAFNNPGCSCLALTIYHELLHDSGLSHSDPGDPVTAMDKKCQGNLCK